MKESLQYFLRVAEISASKTADVSGSKAFEHQLRDWNQALADKNANATILLLSQFQALAANPSVTVNWHSAEIAALLIHTVQFARERKSEKTKLRIEGSSGPRDLEIANADMQSILESVELFAGAASVYAMRQEFVDAESLLKEAFLLGTQQTRSISVVFNPAMRLGDIYEVTRRFSDAEKI